MASTKVGNLHERLAGSTMTAPLSVVRMRLDVETLALHACAQQGRDLLGFPLDRWGEVGFWKDRLHPDDREDVLIKCVQCIGARIDYSLEYRIEDAEGTMRRLQQTVTFIEDENGPRAEAFISDVSERMETDALLRKSVQLRQELLHLLTREISEPIKTISGFAMLLERHLSMQDDHVGSDFSVGMRDGIERLTDLVVKLVRSINPDERDLAQADRQLRKLWVGLRDEATGA